MKIYVDELPKSCSECPLRSYRSDSYWCASYEGSYILFADEVKEANLCPLQSLTEHDKQVRKEVCEEIKNRSAKSYSGYAFNLGKDVHSYTVCDFVLDEIEQGDKNG